MKVKNPRFQSSGNDRRGSIWIAIQRTPDSAPPDSWILAPGSYY
jgi:hypothetical protein